MLLCSALPRGLQTGSSADPAHRVLRADLSLGRSSPCAHRALIASRPAFRTGSLSCPARLPAVVDRSRLSAGHPTARRRAGKDTKPAERCQANPERVVRVRTPGAAVPVRSRPDWGAGKLPGPAAALGGRARYRPRPPLGEAYWTWPYALCSRHTSGEVSSPAQAAWLARSLPFQSTALTRPGHPAGPGPGLRRRRRPRRTAPPRRPIPAAREPTR